MNIIKYEPLYENKHKKELQVVTNQKMDKDDWIDVSIALTIAFLLALLVISYYPTKYVYSNPVSQIAINTENNSKKTFDFLSYKNNHKLGGIFVSESLKVAMINDEFFRVGDIVDGMEIVMIDSSIVQLKNKEGSLMLRMVI